MRHLIKDDWDNITQNLQFFDDTAPEHDPYERHLFTSEEINYIKKNGNNATLFIHGFNVGYGDYGDAFDLWLDNTLLDLPKAQYYQRMVKSPNISGFAKLKCALYRNPKKSLFTDYLNNDEYSQSDPQLCGTEAHNWWSEMSYNLNLATGEFDPKDYTKYTHVVGIAWQGDPSPINFMADTVSAKYSALKVASLIKQLHLSGITTNVIAHSMGAMVLLSAMSALAEDELSESINHAFLWDAAVPNFSLSNERHPSDPKGVWYFPKATDAAKKISVLYSNNDNVLGPIPNGQVNQDEINKTKPVFGELIPALFLSKMGLESVYEMATWAGDPVSNLFQAKYLQTIYEQWIMQHPLDANGKPFASSLKEQTIRYEAENTHFLNELEAKLKACYASITDDLKAAGHTLIADAIVSGAFLYKLASFEFNQPVDQLAIEVMKIIFSLTDINKTVKNMLTIFDVMFHKSRYNPVAALGYTGPDSAASNVKKLRQQNKLFSVNQTPWLWSHSGMRIPSKAVMTHIYKQHIFTGFDGMKEYGTIKL